ncbi:MAG TPA: hypothetical protein VM368_04380 [Flavisolibacter sp.]|nr:hypothetical protein [Flavisolibacter sp.]
MKKVRTPLIIIFLTLFMGSTFAQTEGAVSKIATIGRYTSNGMELRWMPDNKTILRLGFGNSYTIERTEEGINRYEDIATVKAYSQAEWNSLIAIEKDTVTKNHLEVAMEFLFAPPSEQKGISFDAGIAELNEKKSNEDMIYALFVLTAIKDGKAAEALGLKLIDKTAEAGKTYSYRIKLNATSQVYKIENGTIDIKAAINFNRYKNEVLVITGDKKLSFAWSVDPQVAGYFVERAAEGENIFKPLNKVAIYASKGAGFEGASNGSFDDDSLINYKWYRYRFYGNTAFGEKVLFAEVKGMPKDLTPPEAPILKQPKHVKPKEVSVAWDIYGDTKDLKGFIVARSNKDSGNFNILHKSLLPNKTRNYTDTTFSIDENNYYIVYALDTAGNISSSYPGYVALVDSTPPAAPIVTSAIIDSLGEVTITINPGLEKDLKGYRIFKANSTEHELSAIQEAFKTDKADTSLLKLVFTDTVTLNSLTPKIYYRVKALDYNYNQSSYSEMVTITKPDTIPPITPVFTNVIVKEKQVELYFAPSESIDVKEHVVYRRTNMEADWDVLMKVKPAAKQIIDTNVRTGTTYYYTIRAMDESNLYSGYSNGVYGKPYDSGIRPPIINFTSTLQEKKVILTWDYPSIGKEVFFAIYKKDKKGLLFQYARITGKIFTDEKPDKENVYAIKALTADGGQSVLSAFIIQKTE